MRVPSELCETSNWRDIDVRLQCDLLTDVRLRFGALQMGEFSSDQFGTLTGVRVACESSLPQFRAIADVRVRSSPF